MHKRTVQHFSGKNLGRVIPCISVPPLCRYQAEMSSESTLVPLPVLMKDEKKYAEVVNVLDQLEVWVCRRFRCQTSYLLIISSIKK